MFKKKEKKEINPHSNQIKFFLSNINEAKIYLENAVNSVLRKRNALDVYPEGPDRELAKKELAQARERFLSKIAQYDDWRSQYLAYLKRNQLSVLNYPNPSDSHKLVEIFVYNYWKGA